MFTFVLLSKSEQYKRWNIVDSLGTIIFNLDRYQWYIHAHGTDTFYNSWLSYRWERLEKECREKVERLDRERIERGRAAILTWNAGYF